MIVRPYTARHNALTVFVIVLIALALMLLSGCNQARYAEADRLRLETVKPVIRERVERRPEEKQSWDDFITAWEMSIEARSAQWSAQ